MNLTTALTVLFIALKLLGKIDWSWWIVAAPTWVPLSIVAVCWLIQAIVIAFETPQEKAARSLRELAEKMGVKK